MMEQHLFTARVIYNSALVARGSGSLLVSAVHPQAGRSQAWQARDEDIVAATTSEEQTMLECHHQSARQNRIHHFLTLEMCISWRMFTRVLPRGIQDAHDRLEPPFVPITEVNVGREQSVSLPMRRSHALSHFCTLRPTTSRRVIENALCKMRRQDLDLHLGSISPTPSMTTPQPGRLERHEGRWSYDRG